MEKIRQRMTPKQFKEKLSRYKERMREERKCRWCSNDALVFLKYISGGKRSGMGGGIVPKDMMYACYNCGKISFVSLDRFTEAELENYLVIDYLNFDDRKSNKKNTPKRK